MGWLLEEFGDDVLLRPIVRPADFVPADYDGTIEAARALFGKVCERMELPAEHFELRFDQGGRGGDRTVVVPAGLLAEPEALTVLFAQKAGREVLLGSGRIRPDRRGRELTDLFAVFTGFGILMANVSHTPLPEDHRIRFYLREVALTDALAYYALLREERALPSWQQHLDWPVRIRTMSRLSKLEEAAAAK